MKLIPLTQNKFAKVDDNDYEWLSQWNWHYDCKYAIGSFGHGIKISMHRFIMQTPQGMDTDHIDLDGLNNQRNNLRICTRSQNKTNTNPPKSNTSGYKGVSWRKDIKRWAAHIRINGRKTTLGYFDNIEIAAHAYDEAAKQYHGEFARLNFPLENNDEDTNI